MAKITVIYAHPDPEKSLANRNIIDKFHALISWHMMPEDCPVADIVEKAGNHAEKLVKISGR